MGSPNEEEHVTSAEEGDFDQDEEPEAKRQKSPPGEANLGASLASSRSEVVVDNFKEDLDLSDNALQAEINRQAARFVYCPECGACIVPGFTECPECHLLLVKLDEEQAELRGNLLTSEGRKLGLELFATFRVPCGLGGRRDQTNMAFLKDLELKCRKAKHNPPTGFSGYRERFQKDDRFRERMIEIGRGIDFCDPWLNRDRDEEWHRREKGKRYAAARKAEWETWQSGAGDLPEFGSTRTANKGRSWQHVGKVAAALAAASSVPRGDAAKAVAVLRKEFSIAYDIPTGSKWFLYT